MLKFLNSSVRKYRGRFRLHFLLLSIMKKSILLLHGAIGSKNQLTPLLPFLNKEFDIHTLNFPGHGGDEISDEPFSISYFAGEVLKYFDQKNISSLYIFGYSMGGYVALYL